ncbi:MAG TPA: cache domain-containing protein [Sinomonas sp.]|nr:cache domain-containing protein [Sinomonas sp.]
MTSLEDSLQTTADALARRLDAIFAQLTTLSEAAAGILSGTSSGSRASRSSLESLRPAVEDLISEQEGLVDSAGVSVAPGVVADAEVWHQWWSLIDGRVAFIPHNLNPASVNYYDYTEMTWFERPFTSGSPELTGPYIDFGGAFDMKVVTAGRPVGEPTKPLGIVGADLSMDSLEREFLRHLGRQREHVALVTETGKVVASNSARYAPGTRFEGPQISLLSIPVPAAELASPPWRIVVTD